jgi:hypothetical protein
MVFFVRYVIGDTSKTFMFYRIFPALPALIILGIVWISYLGICLVRALELPRCRRCGASKVRRSKFDGIVDGVAASSLLVPCRCSGCRARFYVLALPAWVRGRFTSEKAKPNDAKAKLTDAKAKLTDAKAKPTDAILWPTARSTFRKTPIR